MKHVMGAATGPKSSAGLCTGQQRSCCPPHSRLNLLRDWVICPQTRLDLEAKTYPKVGASILRNEPEGQCGGGAGKQWRKRRVSGLKGTLWAGQGWSKSSSVDCAVALGPSAVLHTEIQPMAQWPSLPYSPCTVVTRLLPAKPVPGVKGRENKQYGCSQHSHGPHQPLP